MLCKTRNRRIGMWIAIAVAIAAAVSSANCSHAQPADDAQPLPRATSIVMTLA